MDPFAPKTPRSTTKRPFGRHPNWMPGLVGFIGLLLSLLIYQVVHQRESRLFDQHFEQHAREAVAAIEHELTATCVVLESLSAFYAASETVTREQFRAFTTPLITRHPSIHALSFNRRVELKERDAFEDLRKRDRYPEYQIVERGTDGKLIRAVDRMEYVVVDYIEPIDGNEAAMGFDVASESRRNEAFTRARDTGRLAVTSRLTLVQEPAKQFGVLLCSPIYHKEVPTVTLQDRRINIKGYVVGVFRIGEIIDTALSRRRSPGINIRLTDENASRETKLLYAYDHGDLDSSISMTDPDPIPSAEPFAKAAIEFAGRRWIAHCTPSLVSRICGAYPVWAKPQVDDRAPLRSLRRS